MNDHSWISPEREALIDAKITLWIEEIRRDRRAKALQEVREEVREEIREEVRQQVWEEIRPIVQRCVTLRLADTGHHTPQREAALARVTYTELAALADLPLAALLAALDARADPAPA
jgi:hypothetical protein